MKRLLATAILICLIVSTVAMAGGSGTMGWTAPTSYTDGKPIPVDGIKEYRLYSGTASGVYTGFVTIPSSTTQYIVTKATGTFFFVITAVTQENIESDYSNEISRYFQPQKPGACTLNWK